jgi:RNA polymerase sigma-70 factor (ECF subfamily)
MVVVHSRDAVAAALPGDGTGQRTREIDIALLKHVAGGGRDALAALYERHAPLVYGLACSVVRSPSLAEEVTQDVFRAVWVRAATFDQSRGSARTWILSIAHQQALDVVRRQESARLGPSTTAQGRPSLRSLTGVQCAAVELAYFGGLTCDQVAERLQLPVSTATSQMRDGLRRLASEHS